MERYSLLTTIKAIFLFAITSLVIINTYVLVYLVPIVGYHIMPDNQAGAELWKVVTLIMEGCLTAIIICVAIYGTIKLVNFFTDKVKG